MALVEGGGGAVTPSKPKPRGSKPEESQASSAPARAGVSRLQEYVAEPSAPATAPAASREYGGQTYAPRTVAEAPPLAQSYEFGGQTYASRGAATPPDAEADAIKTDVAAQEEQAKTYRARRTKEMSWDDYLGLGDRARAAVDFNTMLVQARQKDLRSDYEGPGSQKQVYDEAVERMFGKDGGSETFAPETVAMLNDIDFQQTDARRFDDLDDFLGLSAALTAKDLDRIGKVNVSPLQPGIDAVAGFAGAAVGVEQPQPNAITQLAQGTNAMQEALTRGNQVLENWKQVAAGARNESVGFFGGTENRVASPDIRAGKDTEYFQLAFDTLADATNGPEVLGAIQQDLGDREFQRFMAYADTKSKYSLDQGVGLGGDPAVQYRSPDEFRQILGLGGQETGKSPFANGG